jgi:excisionase family DNA binding protein
MESNQDHEWMTRQQVADLFQVKAMTVYTWGRQGKITPHKIGRAVRYRRDEVTSLPKPVPADKAAGDE